MKLKYNHKGKTNEIPLITDKPQSKRLAVRKNGQTYYAPLVPTADSAASDIHLVFGGETFAVQSQPPPEVTAVNVAPSSVAVMQGQSATATVSAVGNEYISGLSYGLSGAPTWITISDDLILIQPSDNDLGFANVQVIAQDTSSDAMSSAILRAEAKLRPIIESLSVIPPAVTVQQGQSAVATVNAVANEAVTGLAYSIDGAPSWVTLADDSIVVAPTDNDSGSAVMTVFAYDNNSSASAATAFNATAKIAPKITDITCNKASITGQWGVNTTIAQVTAIYEGDIEDVIYSLENAPPWLTMYSSGSIIVYNAPASLVGASVPFTVTAADINGATSFSKFFNVTVSKQKCNSGTLAWYETGNNSIQTANYYSLDTLQTTFTSYIKGEYTLDITGNIPTNATVTCSTEDVNAYSHRVTISIKYNKSGRTVTTGASDRVTIAVSDNDYYEDGQYYKKTFTIYGMAAKQKTAYTGSLTVHSGQVPT